MERSWDVSCDRAVRGGKQTIDIDNVNRVLMQPYWQKDTDLTDY